MLVARCNCFLARLDGSNKTSRTERANSKWEAEAEAEAGAEGNLPVLAGNERCRKFEFGAHIVNSWPLFLTCQSSSLFHARAANCSCLFVSLAYANLCWFY